LEASRRFHRLAAAPVARTGQQVTHGTFIAAWNVGNQGNMME